MTNASFMCCGFTFWNYIVKIAKLDCPKTAQGFFWLAIPFGCKCCLWCPGNARWHITKMVYILEISRKDRDFRIWRWVKCCKPTTRLNRPIFFVIMYPGASIRSAYLKFGMYRFRTWPYDPKPKTRRQVASNWMGFGLEWWFFNCQFLWWMRFSP